MGVATGASLQSLRFTAANVPYGHYDLCVIANGISSHCVSFCHHRPKKRCCCDVRINQTSEICCGEVCDDDPCCEEDYVVDPEIVELKKQVKGLQNSMHRLSSLVKTEEPVREPKEKAKKEVEEERTSRKSKKK
jgi:hypothetical protein